MAILGISIGVGDFVAGRVSGGHVRPGLIPLGAVATTILFFWLAWMPLNFWLVSVSLSLTGFMAGFVMVPLQTMTQQLSADEERGQVLGLWNCLSFVGIILGNLLFLVVKLSGVSSNHAFVVCGILGLLFLAFYYGRWQSMFFRATNRSAVNP
jgi:sugar phosphate permease